MSLVRAEMAEQPAVLERLLSDPAIAAVAREIRARSPRYAVLAARGSSDNAARYAQHVFGRFWGLPVALATPSLHTLYDAPMRYEDALVIGISQSGESPDVASVVAAATNQGALTIAITNEPGSPLGSAARHVIDLQTGPERSVAATKTYTASLGAIAALVGDASGIPEAVARQLERDVPVPSWERVAVIARGANYGTAFEAALKISELAGAVAVPFSSADFLHGPIAIVVPDFPILAIAPSGPTLPGMREVFAAAAAADITVISDDAALADIPLEPVPEWLSPLVAVIPAQQIAVGMAERLGRNVDRPPGLQKVTRTA
ncbi:MAG TPA: SIS domain-containing protein [Solirubrobacter sp.]|nr:SIS domain-containing protein [Solirubrobacter sp.]